ncbi:hypothetical protein BASA81_008844 [Batrachochytrium salamandrivorans]|nr:hypothetical protein BASA81_008844 [Batrachochytrium salamandrivorans]
MFPKAEEGEVVDALLGEFAKLKLSTARRKRKQRGEKPLVSHNSVFPTPAPKPAPTSIPISTPSPMPSSSSRSSSPLMLLILGLLLFFTFLA